LRLAIVGLGAAGNARLRAAREMPDVEIAAIVSRRPLPEAIGLDQALGRPDIDAFAISTENSDHERSVRAALERGKHVLCDYPLAFTATAALELFDLARARQRILHVEQIALLTGAHREARNLLGELGVLIEGSFTFTGGWSAAEADRSRSGPFPILVESRMMQLWDLFGPARAESVRWHADEDGALFEADLAFDRGGRVRFTERRAPGLPRRRSLEARCEKGAFTWPEEALPGGLFAEDLAIFRELVLRFREDYCRERELLAVMEILESAGG
jgi:predicted dehydrogenase